MALWRPRAAALAGGLVAGGIALSGLWSRETGVLAGNEPPAEIVIDEEGARFAIEVRRGHKTGWFLDQRENRLRVRELAARAEVLDLFAYAGGFAVHAALGGARRVTLVDRAAPALAAARKNLERNRLEAERFELCAEDAFAFLARCAATGRRFDLVVCDPPSFAPSARARESGLFAYRRLNRAALEVLAKGGILCSASCSSHVSGDDLAAQIAQAAADAGRRLRLVERRGAAGDHPVIPGFPEGNYLAFLIYFSD
jgi:23S rRNA (cytosine1962-C5)-methyltransferase